MIRKGKASEIEALLKITRACAQKMTAEGIHQWNEYYPSFEAFQNDCEREELFVLELEGKIIGCITLSSLKDPEYEEIQWLTPEGKNLYVHRLAVHPDYQGRGYAKTLMDYAESEAKNRGALSIRLDTFSLNPRNQKFYKARGYQQLGDIYFPKQSSFPFHCFEKLL